MVVHQPRHEIWAALDDVLLLAPGGRTVFIGARADVAAHFAAPPLGWNPRPADNPADFYMDQARERATATARARARGARGEARGGEREARARD